MARLCDSMVDDHPARPCLVVSNVAKAGGVAKAQDRGVPTAIVDHRGFDSRAAFEHAMLAVLEPYAPDVICLAGFMRVLTPVFIDAYAGRILNTHPSLLPKYRGLNTHRRALEAGDAQAGCTVHIVTRELDDGPILGQARVAVRPGDTADSLAARVLAQEHLLYPAVLRRFVEGHTDRLELTG